MGTFELEEDWEGWVKVKDREKAHDHLPAEAWAALKPDNDYFEVMRFQQPKKTIGEYVVDQGFNVPLITSQAEWEAAFDDGTAMLRSELEQDYDGLSGLFSSERLSDAVLNMHEAGFGHNLGSLVMRGLRSGELDATEYMTYLRGHLSWTKSETHLVETIGEFDPSAFIIHDFVTASRWRYVEGTNVSVFADPNVEGRYHFGVLPGKHTSDNYQTIGGYQFEAGEYDTPKRFRKHDVDFVARPFIEYYEQIRNLPRFDTTQCPVLELQQDPAGDIHFLQYLKTGQRQEFVEPFDLPATKTTLRLNNVRGVTPPEGTEMRMFFEPAHLTESMKDQAIFGSIFRPRRLEVQLACQAASFFLHRAYISFQDNHFDSSPLFRPSLAAGLDSWTDATPQPVLERIEKILELTSQYSIQRQIIPYLDIKVTSNGREAAIESDWDLQAAAYADI